MAETAEVQQQQPQKTCEFYVTARGCIKGDSCDFLHPAAPNGTVTSKVCEFFNLPRGCAKGAECDFLHPVGLRRQPNPSMGMGGMGMGGMGMAPAGQQICKFFNSPQGCKKGPQCEFYHPPMAGGMPGGMQGGMQGGMPGGAGGRPGAKQCDYFFSPRGCIKGDQCDFSHGNQGMFGAPMGYGQMGGGMGMPGMMGGGRGPGFGVQKKAQKCDFFTSERGCIKGDLCDFIHVKEKVCDFFLSEKGCRKGKFCDFSHPEKDGEDANAGTGATGTAEERAKARAAKRYAPY